jgi:hypothetical protein
MPQEDDDASELNHPEEIFWVVFPANDGATKVMKPGEQALHFPATPVATQNAAVLRGSCNAHEFVGRDELHAVSAKLQLGPRACSRRPVSGVDEAPSRCFSHPAHRAEARSSQPRRGHMSRHVEFLPVRAAPSVRSTSHSLPPRVPRLERRVRCNTDASAGH